MSFIRQKNKPQTQIQQEKFEEGPQFALVLNEELSQIQISTISKQLSMHGLIVLQSQTLDRKKNILFVELSNLMSVFQEAEELKIRKNIKLSKTQIIANKIRVRKNAYQLKQQQLLEHQQQQNLLSPYQTTQASNFKGIIDPVNGGNNDNVLGEVLSAAGQNSHQNGSYLDNSNQGKGNKAQVFRFEMTSPSNQSQSQELSSFPQGQQNKNYQNGQQSQDNPFDSEDPMSLLSYLQQQSDGLQNGNQKSQGKNSSSSNGIHQKLSKREEIALLDSVDPRIVQFEKMNDITIAMLYDLDKEGNLQLNTKGLGIFSPSERLRITYSFMNKIRIKDLRFLEYLQDQQLVTEIIPMHEKNAVITDAIQSLESYYGENISTYFEFLDFYQKWLLAPAILGFFTYFLSRNYFSQQLYFYFLYTFFICIWTTLFYIYWKRYESELQVKWGVFGKKIYKEDRNFNFRGVKRLKVTTLCEEEYYPRSKRFHLYIISTLESLPLLLLAFCMKIIIFNLNGLIKSEESLFYFSKISSLTQEGGILYNLPFKETIFNVGMIVVIIKINEIYMSISNNSTRRENHRTNNDFNQSLVIKRFIFDLINRFTHFFFIAFVIRDVNSLKTLLGSLFLMDEVRKVATESVVPWVMKKLISMKKQKETSPEEEDNTLKKNEELNQLYSESIREIEMLSYDDFDDYIEVIAQIAFITLFAAVAPLAASFSYLFNILERSSDRFKLINRLYRRPLPFKVQGINAWNKVIFLISLICVFTNVAFLSFEYYKIYDLQIELEHNLVCTDSDYHKVNSINMDKTSQLDKLDDTWQNVYISMFTIEHLILFLITVLHYFISLQPKWVRVYKRRMNLHLNSEEQQNLT